MPVASLLDEPKPTCWPLVILCPYERLLAAPWFFALIFYCFAPAPASPSSVVLTKEPRANSTPCLYEFPTFLRFSPFFLLYYFESPPLSVCDLAIVGKGLPFMAAANNNSSSSTSLETSPFDSLSLAERRGTLLKTAP